MLPLPSGLRATHRGFVFVEHLVVAAERDAEDDGRDVLEAVDPLLAFRSLAPDVKQPARKTGMLVGGRVQAGAGKLGSQAVCPERGSRRAPCSLLHEETWLQVLSD